jgi:hypothetical protein
MNRIGSHLTFANVVAVIALFVALGGTALAAVMITSNSQVGQGVISGHKAPSGKHPNVILGSIGAGDLASGSVTPAKLKTPATFISAGLADPPGTSCSSGNYWFNKDPDVTNATSYYRDPSGIVYLRGDARKCGQANSTIFALPPGYRPLRTENHVAETVNPADAPTMIGTVAIHSDGGVTGGGSFGSVAEVWLDGIVFRCGPSGQNGCP